MIFFRKKNCSTKETDLLIDLEFLFMASWSAVEAHSVHRNVGHLFWRNLHLQEAAAEKNNGWEEKRKKRQNLQRDSTTKWCKCRRNPHQHGTQISCQKHEEHTSYTPTTRTHQSTTTSRAQTHTSNTAWKEATIRTDRNRRSNVNRGGSHGDAAACYYGHGFWALKQKMDKWTR